MNNKSQNIIAYRSTLSKSSKVGVVVDDTTAYYTQKEKKMGWFKKRVRNWLNDTAEEYPETTAPKFIPDHNTIEAAGINFNVHKASGGFIIETRGYDVINDRRNNKLHVITDEDNLGIEIGKIITMECLRR